MAPDVLEVIVNAMEQVLAARRVRSAHMRRAARHVVQPVARESVVVLCANEQGRPVVLAVAASRPLRLAVELGVRDSHLARGAPAGDDELAANEGDLAVVDPDVVRPIKGDGIAAPDVLRVEVGDVDVLDDDVALAAADAQALADDDALCPDADDGLVAVHVYGCLGGIVVRAVDPGTAGSVAGVLDPRLALGGAAGALGRPIITAAFTAGRTLGVAEVPGTIDHDGPRCAVREPCFESDEYQSIFVYSSN